MIWNNSFGKHQNEEEDIEIMTVNIEMFQYFPSPYMNIYNKIQRVIFTQIENYLQLAIFYNFRNRDGKTYIEPSQCILTVIIIYINIVIIIINTMNYKHNT